MISGDIDLDKLVDDIDQQLEILTAIAADNAILNEQLRLLQACREAVLSQSLEITRLLEMVDPDETSPLSELTTILERYQLDGEGD
ncbi:MAG: hypothetical protein ACE37D_12875 [Pseudomonadales bacterium]